MVVSCPLSINSLMEWAGDGDSIPSIRWRAQLFLFLRSSSNTLWKAWGGMAGGMLGERGARSAYVGDGPDTLSTG